VVEEEGWRRRFVFRSETDNTTLIASARPPTVFSVVYTCGRDEISFRNISLRKLNPTSNTAVFSITRRYPSEGHARYFLLTLTYDFDMNGETRTCRFFPLFWWLGCRAQRPEHVPSARKSVDGHRCNDGPTSIRRPKATRRKRVRVAWEQSSDVDNGRHNEVCWLISKRHSHV